MILNILSTTLFCLYLMCSVTAEANEVRDDPFKQILIIMVNQLSLEDVRQMEQLDKGDWLQRGYIGAVNLKTAGTMNDVNNVVTFGSGTRAVGADAGTRAYSGHEQADGILAKDSFYQYNGFETKPDNVFIPGIQHVLYNNLSQPYTIIPGLLGQTLHEQGLKTAVWGNSDKGEEPYRIAALMVMDRMGIVDMGDVSARTSEVSVDQMYGLRTNYSYLETKMSEVGESAAVSVIELGDLYRLYAEKRGIAESYFYQQKGKILTEVNGFMSRLVDNQREDQLIILLSPMIHEDAQALKSLMSPLVILAPQGNGGTVFTSTTRQTGIVGNVDIAPSILHWLGLSTAKGMVGRPISFTVDNGSFWTEWERIKHIHATRSQVLYSYVTFQIIVLIVGAGLWLYAFPGKLAYDFANRFIRFLLIVLTLSPFLFLLLPLFPRLFSVNLTVVVLFTLGFSLAAILGRVSFVWMFFLVSLINWVPILLDGILGQSALMKRSYLGYDPIIGARYYGIGNEYMGVVIGSSILSLGMLLEWAKHRMHLIKGLAVTVFGLYLLFFSLPKWGTNAGGALTAVAAYSTSFIRLFHIPLNRKFIFWGMLAVFISLSTLFFVNMIGEDETQSHIGRAMNMLIQGDVQEISNIVERKLEMNWKLIRVSSWSKVFITSLLILGLLCYRPPGVMGHLSRKYPYVFRSFFGIIVGAFTALIVNDSGIVAAATTIIYMVVPLLYLGLKEKMG